MEVTPQQLDILKIIMQSGLIVKGVLLLLLISSVLSWGVVFYKMFQFKKIEKDNSKFMDKYSNCTNLKEIADFCEQESNAIFASLYLEGYSSIAKLKGKFSGHSNPHHTLSEHIKVHGLSSVERGIKKAMSEVGVELEVFLSFLASIGSVAPFIGLFGTVWGIIHSFTGLSSGSATLAAVAPGIAEALVATAVGLFAAIPAVWFYNKFSSRIQDLQSEMDSFGYDFMNLIERSLIVSRPE